MPQVTALGFSRIAFNIAPGVVLVCIWPISGGGGHGAVRAGDAATPSDSIRRHYPVKVRRVLLSPSVDGRPC
ncbi:hypothetical protein, partial [Rhizobium johnstonii]|uniref:hypothetical protein n=1 Tax=Rhizobium johnstonii TaxID=3019933 RepID=UPI003F979059